MGRTISAIAHALNTLSWVTVLIVFCFFTVATTIVRTCADLSTVAVPAVTSKHGFAMMKVGNTAFVTEFQLLFVLF